MRYSKHLWWLACLALSSGAAFADSQYYWTCLNQPECKNVHLQITEPLPVDVNLRCQNNTYGSWRPNWITVKTPGGGATCGDQPQNNGEYLYIVCNPNLISDKSFSAKVDVDCRRSAEQRKKR